MTNRQFVHLHCHSHYSLFQGTATIDKLVSRTVELGMNALALTDHSNLYGAMEFYMACKAAGINPIIGYGAYVAPKGRFLKDASSKVDYRYRLTLLAQNRKGYENLLTLSSKAYLEGFCRTPRIDRELLEDCREGLICLSGSAPSELWRSLIDIDPSHPQALNRARAIASRYHELFGDRYFIEIQDIDGLEEMEVTQRALTIASELGIPPVATSKCYSLDLSDASSLEVLLCIRTRQLQTDPTRVRQNANDFYFKSPEDMYDSFPGLDRSVVADAVARSQTIADTVSIELELGKRHFPSFEVPSGRTASDELRELCIRGLRQRYVAVSKRWADGMSPAEGGNGELASDVVARLEYELDAITTRGLADYFLMVATVVRIARENKILTSTRGTSSGSLVVYSLLISHVCPLEHGLLFERFLDIPGDAAPDIYIDVCEKRRNRLIDYLQDRYGRAYVARVSQRETRSAQAAIREVGRVLGLEAARIESIVALIPSSLGITVDAAAAPDTELAQLCTHDNDVATVVFRASSIDGLVSAVRPHPVAVVIADRPLKELVPLWCEEGAPEIFTQWPSGDLKRVGLKTMNLLGSRHLTTVSKALDLIEARTGTRPDPLAFPLDDHATFATLSRGDADGVFQLESDGMREALQRIMPNQFVHLVAAIALCRPGPLDAGMLDDYVKAKKGRIVAQYAHAAMEDVLAETYGVLIFQEQAMRILERIGGIDLASGQDHMKVFGKQWTQSITEFSEAFQAFRNHFFAGAQSKGISESEASGVFADITMYGPHAFTKSHAAAYALLSFQMAYLKTHWRDEFDEACQTVGRLQ